MQYLANPLSGLEMAAFLQAVLAMALLSVWLKGREPGLLWLTFGFAALALTPFMPHESWGDNVHVASRAWASCTLIGLVMIVVGVAIHLRILSVPGGRSLLLLMVLPTLVILACMASSWPMTRFVVNACITVMVLILGLLCIMAGIRERVTGHWAAALSFISLVVLLWVSYANDPPPVVIKTLLNMPAVLLGLSMLVASLQRRQRTLETEVALRTKAEDTLKVLNTSLEDQVAQRTADLRSMLGGLESFNRSVSHDLRGPLGSMASLARMAHKALSHGDTRLVERVLPDMARQADALHRMVNSLLELARVSDQHYRRKPVDAQQLVQQVVADLASANPQLPVVDSVKAGPLPQLMTDPDMLTSVLVNLIGNALKFSKPGALPEVEVGVLEQATHEYTLFVRDQGLGFDESRSAELFKPFTRLHGHVVEGHGIGLSIVARAVERLGGRIWVHSKPGQGTCFYFTVPRLS